MVPHAPLSPPDAWGLVGPEQQSILQAPGPLTGRAERPSACLPAAPAGRSAPPRALFPCPLAALRPGLEEARPARRPPAPLPAVPTPFPLGYYTPQL